MKKEYLAAVQAPEGATGKNIIEIQGFACYVFEFETEEGRESFIEEVYEKDGTVALRVGLVEKD